MRVEDLELLAKVYGVSPDRLFFAPGDTNTPERMRRFYEIVTTKDGSAVDHWLATGESLKDMS